MEDGGSVRRPPRVKKVVLASGHEPLARVGKLEAEDAALVEMQLVLVRLVAVEHLDVGVLHTNSQPVPCGAPTQTEDLTAKVVLLELSSLPEVPGPHRVV